MKNLLFGLMATVLFAFNGNAQAGNSNDDLTKFNDAINEMCTLNKINNKLEFVKVIDNDLNPLKTLSELKNYNFKYTSSIAEGHKQRIKMPPKEMNSKR
jgi:hypothetical protein